MLFFIFKFNSEVDNFTSVYAFSIVSIYTVPLPGANVAGKRALVQLIEERENADSEWYDLVMIDNEWKVDLGKYTRRNNKIRRSRKLKKHRKEEQNFYDKLHDKSFKLPASYKEKD